MRCDEVWFLVFRLHQTSGWYRRISSSYVIIIESYPHNIRVKRDTGRSEVVTVLVFICFGCFFFFLDFGWVCVWFCVAGFFFPSEGFSVRWSSRYLTHFHFQLMTLQKLNANFPHEKLFHILVGRDQYCSYTGVVGRDQHLSCTGVVWRAQHLSSTGVVGKDQHLPCTGVFETCTCWFSQQWLYSEVLTH